MNTQSKILSLLGRKEPLFSSDLTQLSLDLISNNQWPCYFFNSDTTGEKDFEEFFTEKEDLDLSRFDGIGVIKNQPIYDSQRLDDFFDGIEELRKRGSWQKQDIVDLFFDLLPDFAHKETGKYLDERM